MDRLTELYLIGMDSLAHGKANIPASQLLQLCLCVRAADALFDTWAGDESYAARKRFAAVRAQLEQSP